MVPTEFIFRCRPLTGDALLPQVSRALEKRTELLSREQYPGLWSRTDQLRAVAQDRSRTTRHRRITSAVLLVLGVVLLVPGLVEHTAVLLIAGAAGVAVGLGGLIGHRAAPQSAFDLAAEKLLASRALIGDDQVRVLFHGDAMTIEQDHVGEEVPYDQIPLAVETADTWLLVFGERAMVLLKQDLSGDHDAFARFLEERVHCEQV